MHTHVRDSKANQKERNPHQQGQITIGIMTAKSQVGTSSEGRANMAEHDTSTRTYRQQEPPPTRGMQEKRKKKRKTTGERNRRGHECLTFQQKLLHLTETPNNSSCLCVTETFSHNTDNTVWVWLYRLASSNKTQDRERRISSSLKKLLQTETP